jgi:Flp pilus assembly protein TadD
VWWFAALLLFAQDPEAVYRQGVDLLQSGRAEQAVPLLEQAAQAARNNAQYWKAAGVALASLSRYRESVEPFEKACRLDRRLTDACYYYGRALYASDRYADALEPLRRAMDVDAVKGRAETAMGQSLEALGRNEEAEKYFRSALARKDDHVRGARIAYGQFLLRQGRVDEALRTLESAQESESPEGLLEYARALMQAGDSERAVSRLERLIQISPRDPAPRFLLAKAYRRLGRSADAVRQEQAGRELTDGR